MMLFQKCLAVLRGKPPASGVREIVTVFARDGIARAFKGSSMADGAISRIGLEGLSMHARVIEILRMRIAFVTCRTRSLASTSCFASLLTLGKFVCILLAVTLPATYGVGSSCPFLDKTRSMSAGRLELRCMRRFVASGAGNRAPAAFLFCTMALQATLRIIEISLSVLSLESLAMRKVFMAAGTCLFVLVLFLLPAGTFARFRTDLSRFAVMTAETGTLSHQITGSMQGRGFEFDGVSDAALFTALRVSLNPGWLKLREFLAGHQGCRKRDQKYRE
ncbi:MAG: hypothetical protein A2X94_02670 [Bdellovibrionales bacterium GWB1_55_8]|nr:MAG: hypothetical protein A2X94_02670 [Bdellovibrionales bacterium GWB1_55_8]